jgi:tetratricopeptide (TPR) repeat protein
MAKGELAEAASHLQQALKADTAMWQYWADLGWVYHRQAKQRAVRKAYTRALALLEGTTDAASASATAAATAGAATAGEAPAAERYKAELADVLSGSSSGSSSSSDARAAAAAVRVRCDMGQAYREIGQVDEAVAALEAALLLAPADTLARTGTAAAALAQAHARTSEGLYGAAAECLRRGAAVAEAHLADTSSSSSSSSEGARTALKLLGDLRLYAHRLPPSCFGGAAQHSEFVQGAVAAYEQGLTLLPPHSSSDEDTAAGHYDVGLALLLRAHMLRLQAGEGCGLWSTEAYTQVSKNAIIQEIMAVIVQAIIRVVNQRYHYVLLVSVEVPLWSSNMCVL